MYESPMPVDEPGALYRVQCPVCRQNVWAGIEEPPAQGEEILAEHDCPGPGAVLAESGIEPEQAASPRRSPRKATRKTPAASTVTDSASPPDAMTNAAPHPRRMQEIGHPAYPAPPLGPPE